MDSIAQCHCQFNFEASQRQFPGPSQSLVEEYKSRNKYPLLHEADSIRAEMEGAKGQEALLSEKIASLRSTITFLTDERARVRRQIGDYRWILRPVHKLPPELLERIFSFTLNPSASEDPFQASSSLHPSGMPWVLAQVCQSWRNLALSTPSLWKHVMLSFPSRAMDQSNLQAQIYRLNSQLHRSEDHPLEVITSTRYSTKDTEPLLILLCSQSRRWRTLKIELEDKDAHTFSLIRGSLPLLESLHIYCIERLQSIFDCFEFVPRLRSLTLSGEYIANGGAFHFKLPIDQIQHFYHPNPTLDSYAQCYIILFNLRRHLHVCRLSFHSESLSRFLALQNTPGHSGTFVPLSFPNLTELELHSTEGTSGVEVMLSWINVKSALKIFTIFSTGPSRTPFERFFEGPASLSSLTIHRVEMPAAEFSAVLALLTGLKNLIFGVRDGITNDYLELLRATAATDFSIVAKLQTLALLLTPGTQSQYDDEVLADLLELRWRGPSTSISTSPPCDRLLSVELDHRIAIETVRSRLAVLHGEGMRIEEP